MEKLTTTHIAMLIAQVRGEGGWKKLATKGAGIKQLGNMLTEKYGEGSANETMEALDVIESFDAATLLITNLKLQHEGKPPVDAVAGKQVNTEVTDADAKPVKQPKAPKAPKQPKTDAARGSRGNRDKVITIVDGKDPFRAGTQSGDTWALMKKEPGLTFQQYLDKGARANTILGAIRNGWVTLK